MFYIECTNSKCDGSNDDFNEQCLSIVSTLLPQTRSMSESKDISDNIKIEPIVGGASGKIMKISNQASNEAVVLRFYNPAMWDLRRHQTLCNIFDKHLQCGPKILGEFADGHIEEYLHNFQNVDKLTKDELNSDSFCKEIGIVFANMHFFDASKVLEMNTNESFTNVFMMRNNPIVKDENKRRKLEWLESFFVDELKTLKGLNDGKYKSKCDYTDKNWFNFLDIEWEFLEDMIKKHNVSIFVSNDNYINNKIELFKPFDIVFSHRDAHARNVMVKKEKKEKKEEKEIANGDRYDMRDDNVYQVRFVDFEITGYTDRVYDLSYFLGQLVNDRDEYENNPQYKRNLDQHIDFLNSGYREKVVGYYLNQCIKLKLNDDENYVINQENKNKLLFAIDIAILRCHLLLACYFGIQNNPDDDDAHKIIKLNQIYSRMKDTTLDKFKLYFTLKSRLSQTV